MNNSADLQISEFVEEQIEFALEEAFSEELLLLEAPPHAVLPGEVETLTQGSESENHEISLPAALCDDRLLMELKSIPNKMGFKIGEVAEMLGVKQYVLRYWETEFDVLKPKKANNNQRYFTKKDVENAYLIRKLLHRDRFSIEGARAAMKDLRSFAKKEVKKEVAMDRIQTQFETLHDQVDDLIIEIRHLKSLFA